MQKVIRNHRKHRNSALFFTTMFVLFLWGVSHGDTITLLNGNQLSGRIISENDDAVFFAISGAEMRIDRRNIREIQRTLPVDYLLHKSERAKEAARRYLASQRNDRASDVLLKMMLEIEEALAAADEEDNRDPLVKELDTLHQERRKTVPPDPNSQEAERLYTQALRDIDHIRDRDALPKLQRATELDPQRSDIHILKAQTATRLGRRQEAINAYRAVLEQDAELYYSRVSQNYLELLRQEGQRLVGIRRGDEAIEIFQEILLIQGGDKGKPVDLGDFLARRVTQAQKPNEEVLMEVYRYADDNDLVDLAFAAVLRLDKMGVDSPEHRELLRETRFLADFKAAIDTGDTAEAARLLAQEDTQDLTARPEIAERVRRFTGDEMDELESERLLADAEAAFERRDYKRAEELARRILLDYADYPAVTRATRILAQSESEHEIRVLYLRAMQHIEKGELDEAQTVVASILQLPNINESVQFQDIQRLEARIPRERRADELWMLAREHLDQEEFEEALARLDQLASNFSETMAGKRASEWLADYRQRLLAESRRYRPTDNDFLSFWTNPNYWRAAAMPEVVNRRIVTAPVPDQARRAANEAFRALMLEDMANEPEGRSPMTWLLFPVLGGALLGTILVFKAAPRGRGALHLVEKKEKEDENHHPNHHCRSCGQVMGENDLACPHCGCADRLTQDEEIRKLDEERRSDYDPWSQRVHAAPINHFKEHYDKARELSETSDVQAAIDACRKALNEDPHQKDGYQLLAELYERANQPEEAGICYRELLLLDPSDALVRQKLESVSATPPLEMGKIPVFLSMTLWWMIYFVVIGIDTGWWHLHLALCIAGCILTWLWICESQKNKYVTISERQRGDDMHRPLPDDLLTYRDQAKLSAFLADVIEKHTGYAVPNLGVWRFWVFVLLSVLILAGMGWLVLLGGSPIIFVGWPAGLVLFYYLLEIHPRALTAHVMLRHFMEETLSPWADPHVIFQPKGEKVKPIGEFLIHSQKEFPLRWAMKPHPYPGNHQGVLNNLMQVMNRHWGFHKFYSEAKVVRNMSIPQPAGIKTVWSMIVFIMVFMLGSSLVFTYQEQQARTTYDESMRVGYQFLLEGDVLRARDYFMEAAQYNPSRVAPYLYTAHAYAAAGMNGSAQRSFSQAANRPITLAQAHNDYGNFLQRQGKLRQAIEQYNLALNLQPNNSDILSNAGSAAYKLNDFPLAARFLRRATEVEPNHTRAYTTLGLVLEEMGDRNGARTAYERAVEVAPDLPYTTVARNRLDSDMAPVDAEPLRLEMTRTVQQPTQDNERPS